MGSRAAAGMRHCYEAGDIPTWETQSSLESETSVTEPL
jgi:hypothetical protein